MPLMKFDLEKPTVNDLKKFLPQVKTLKMVAMAHVVAAVAVECPESWGAPDKPETYSTKPFREVLSVAWKELSDANKALDAKVEGLEFDLDKVTPEEFDRLVKDLDSNEPEKMAAIMANFMRKCPKAWGDPSKKETFLKLKYYTEFFPTARALSNAGVGEMENFIKLLTSD